jgi:hypothetical protein
MNKCLLTLKTLCLLEQLKRNFCVEILFESTPTHIVVRGGIVKCRVGSRKVSMGFSRERDFSRDQPCETRLLARLKSRMVSREKSLR